ncbi:MAG: DNA starvation/stationary phase protection protein Dps [Caldilineaceae bacterium]
MAARTSKTSGGRSGAAQTRATMVRSSIDIDEETRGMMIQLLNQQLANVGDLYSQSKMAHWNVKGRDFFQLHELYDTLAEGVLPHADAIAERVTALGGMATGTVRMAAAASQLPEFPATPVMDTESLELMSARYSQAAKAMRAAIDESDEAGDMVTADLFTEITRDLDKFLYFLEAHLQGSQA